MFKVIKLLPLLIVIAGGAAMSKGAGRFIDRVTTRFKVMMTTVELADIADSIRMQFLDTGTVPEAGEGPDFETFMRDNFESRWGGRDPSFDLFENPYMVISEGRQEITVLLYSMGPNGNDDDCVLLNGETQQLEADLLFLENLVPDNLDLAKLELKPSDLQDLDLSAIEELPLEAWQKEEIMKEAMPDDLCIELEFALRDTPFRGLER